jgi:hypothetical protein
MGLSFFSGTEAPVMARIKIVNRNFWTILKVKFKHCCLQKLQKRITRLFGRKLFHQLELEHITPMM